MPKNQRAIKFILAFSAFLIMPVLIFSPLIAQAQDTTAYKAAAYLANKAGISMPNSMSWWQELIYIIVGNLTNLVRKIIGIFIGIGALLLTKIIQITDITNVSFVQNGWTIVRDIANLFFILIMVYIAFSTILDLGTATIKKVLPRLIITALLINFSLVISSFIITSANFMTNDLLKAGLGREPGESVMQGLNLQKNFKLLAESALTAPAQGVTAPLTKLLNLLMTEIASIIFFLMALAVIWVGVLFFIYRIVALWFFIIVSPAAWLAGVLPQTQYLYKNWWNNFLKWTFFAPIYTFFFFLAVQTIRVNSLQTQFSSVAYPVGVVPEIESGFVTNLFTIFQFFIVIGLLLGGLMVADRFGIYGAKGVYNSFQKLGDWASGQIKGAPGWAYRGGRDAARRATEEKIREREIAGKPTRSMRALRLGLGGKMRSAQAIEERRKNIETQTAKIDKLTSPDLARMYQSVRTPSMRAAIIQKLAERNELHKIGGTENLFQVMQNLGGNTKPLLERRPDWAPNPAILGATVRALGNNAANMDPRTLIDDPSRPGAAAEVAKNLSESQVKSIIGSGSPDLRDNLAKKIRDVSGANPGIAKSFAIETARKRGKPFDLRETINIFHIGADTQFIGTHSGVNVTVNTVSGNVTVT